MGSHALFFCCFQNQIVIDQKSVISFNILKESFSKKLRYNLQRLISKKTEKILTKNLVLLVFRTLRKFILVGQCTQQQMRSFPRDRYQIRMLIIVWLCVVARALDNIPIIYSDPPITPTTALPVTHTLNMYTGPDAYFYVYYQPLTEVPPFSYIQVTYDTAASTTTQFNSMNNIFFDPDGYSMQKNQLIIFKPNTTKSNITISIFVTDFQSLTTLSYLLTVNSSETALCPNSCSGNGECQSMGDCQCLDGFYGYDCSVVPEGLAKGRDLEKDMGDGQRYYVRVLAAALAAKVTLTVEKSGGSCRMEIFMRFQTVGSGVISPFSYTKLETLHATEMEYFTYLNPYNANLWILFINKGPQTCHIKSSLGQDTSLGVLLVIIIVVGVAILVALIFGIIFMIRKRRLLGGRVGQIQPQRGINPKNLSSQDIDRYFPVVQASVLGIQPATDHSDFDLLPSKDCVICLCPIQSTDKIRITYCNHIFHKDCLSSWFLKTQNCPYCRQNFDKQHTKQLYDEVVKSCKKKSLKIDDLDGDKLALQVSQYQRSRPLLLIPKLSSDKLVESSMVSINNEDLS